MRLSTRARWGILALCCFTSLWATASTLTFTLGSAVPSFTDGQTGIGTATYNTAVAGNPAPFNGFVGSDVNGPNFSAIWTYNYGAISNISTATLTIGIYDGDSAGAGDQVASFRLGANDLTATLNAAFDGHGGASGEYDIYTITLPSAVFADLAAGTPGFSLSLQNGLGVLGATPFNGAGLDFSTLTINTDRTPPPVPEPASLMLLGSGLAGVLRLRRKK